MPRRVTQQFRPRTSAGSARAQPARAGVLSHHAQLWVDRTFALDYILESLEKILELLTMKCTFSLDADEKIARNRTVSAFEIRILQT